MFVIDVSLRISRYYTAEEVYAGFMRVLYSRRISTVPVRVL